MEDAHAYQPRAHLFNFSRKQMRHTMNRTVYQPMRHCGCRNPIPVTPHNVSPCKSEPKDVVCCNPPAERESCPTVQEPVLAMAYVKIQTLGEVYDPCTALIAGTLFPCLDKPFCGETVSASAYPNPPARTCDCAIPMPTPRDRRECSCERGGDHRG